MSKNGTHYIDDLLNHIDLIFGQNFLSIVL
jgi:hypothetical protein